MKKFMFSAIAMIAFVGSSMANDIAETVIINQDNRESVNCKELHLEITTELAEVSCSDGASFVLHYLMDEMDLTFAQAWRLSSIAFNRCMKERYGSPGFSVN
jgi:hypothetical protein